MAWDLVDHICGAFRTGLVHCHCLEWPESCCSPEVEGLLPPVCPAGLGRVLSLGLGLAEALLAEGSATSPFPCPALPDEPVERRIQGTLKGEVSKLRVLAGIPQHLRAQVSLPAVPRGKGPWGREEEEAWAHPALPACIGSVWAVTSGCPPHACPFPTGCHPRKADLSLPLL